MSLLTVVQTHTLFLKIGLYCKRWKFTAVVSLRTVPLGACGNLFILFVVCLTTIFQ
jgi:hypothetical protein